MLERAFWFVMGWVVAFVCILVAIAVVVATVPAYAGDEGTGPGSDRWPVKISAPAPGAAIVVPVEQLIALPDAPGVTHNEAAYQAARIPPTCAESQTETPCLAEGQAVTTTGWLHLVAAEDDGDFHMQISASADSGSPCLIVEVPKPEYVTDPALRAQAAAVRAYVQQTIFKGRAPAEGGSVLKQPVRVTVTGALFYDDSHVGDAPRGKKGMKAGTLWELHPVSSIALAP